MADISFDTLNFYGTFTAPSGTGDYSLQWLGCPMDPEERDKADFHFFGLNGKLSVDGGAQSTIYTLTGLIVGFDAAGITNAEDAIMAKYDGNVYVLTRWGDVINGVEMLKPEFGRFKTGQFCYETITIPFREL